MTKTDAAKPLFVYSDTLTAAQRAEMQAAAEALILTPVQASKSEKHAPNLHRAIRMAARAGFEILETSNDRVSLVALDKRLKESTLTTLEKIELKAAIAAAGLLL